MSAGTSIEWTKSTWNPIRGTKGRHICQRISPGCKNCYAAAMNRRFSGIDYVAGADTPRLDAAALALPLRWRKPRRIFVCSMTDLFWEAVPDEAIDQVFAVMALAPRHTFQILTKRPDRMRRYMTGADAHGNGVACRIAEASKGQSQSVRPRFALPDERVFKAARVARGEPWEFVATAWPLPNVWLGTSVEDQATADERIPLLLQTPAAVRFVSYEPALGPVDFERFLSVYDRHGEPSGPRCNPDGSPALGWVIVGGESGPGARPFDLAWARSTVEQCKAAGVPVFVKQLGSKPYDSAAVHIPVDAMLIRDRKGGDPSEWPEDLRGVREFPRVAA